MRKLVNNINIKSAIGYIPEMLLLTAGIVCSVADWIWASSVNWAIVFGILTVVALLVWKNKSLALAIAVILGIISVFFILATLSEFGEFPSGNANRWQLLSGGLLIFGSLLVISWFLPRKYLTK